MLFFNKSINDRQLLIIVYTITLIARPAPINNIVP